MRQGLIFIQFKHKYKSRFKFQLCNGGTICTEKELINFRKINSQHSYYLIRKSQ